MDRLNELKKKYNNVLERNKKAESYLNESTYEKCKREIEVKGIGTGKTTFDLFNEVVKELSNLIIKIEGYIGKKMTHYEILNGFNL